MSTLGTNYSTLRITVNPELELCSNVHTLACCTLTDLETNNFSVM